ncbi:MAG: hypothetical protein LBM12_03120 [Candidatus Nomurabacteria bacterium]|jgi:hypothetical protein|nr:hypothetical protein [Candidatus Nomurabacteria bacterium]
MEIDFDALDRAIAQKKPQIRPVSRAASLKTPKYIDVIQAGAVKKPVATRPIRKSSTMRHATRVVNAEVAKPEQPTTDISELIDRELAAGDATLGEDSANTPDELDVNDLVAYAEDSGLIDSTDEPTTPEQAAEDFLSSKHDLVPFLPNVKVEKIPLSGDIPTTHTTPAEPISSTQVSRSERELASELIQDDLVADKSQFQTKPKRKRTAKTKPALAAEPTTAPITSRRSSAILITLLAVLIAVFGAIAGAFIYLITAN